MLSDEEETNKPHSLFTNNNNKKSEMLSYLRSNEQTKFVALNCSLQSTVGEFGENVSTPTTLPYIFSTFLYLLLSEAKGLID